MSAIDRRRARAISQTSARIAKETSAHQRFAVVEDPGNGRLRVAQAHWEAGKYIEIPWNNRMPMLQGAWVLASQVEGTLEAHDYSAYSSGALPT